MVAWYEGLEDMVVSGLKHRTRRPGTADMSMIKNFKEKRLHFYWPYPFVANLKSRVLRTTGWNENKCTRYICPLFFFERDHLRDGGVGLSTLRPSTEETRLG